jgi:hypothetical protein
VVVPTEQEDEAGRAIAVQVAPSMGGLLGWLTDRERDVALAIAEGKRNA